MSGPERKLWLYVFETPDPSPMAAKRTQENSQEKQGPLLGSGRYSGGETPGLGLGKGRGEAEATGAEASHPPHLYLASPPLRQVPHSSLPLPLGTEHQELPRRTL